MKVPPVRPSGLWGAVHDEPAADSAARPPAERAAALRERWAALGQAHLMVGGGCACGYGVGAVELGDFDSLVLGYLRQKYRDAGRERLARLVGDVEALDPLLGRIGANGGLSSDEAAVLLADLERAIGSFEDLHRRG